MDPNNPRLSIFESKSALENSIIIPSNNIMDGTPSKMNPLKTTKQRNTSNNHRKNQQRSTATTGGRNNSTDEDVRGEGANSHPPHLPFPAVAAVVAVARVGVAGDEEGFGKSEGDNENTTNNDEQSGFVDSENDNIAERLCSLSKLSLHNSGLVVAEEKKLGYFSGVTAGILEFPEAHHHHHSEPTAGCSSHSVPISKVRNPSYHPSASIGGSFIESDSVSEAHLKNHFIPVQSSSGCPGGGATTTGDGVCETMDDSSGRRFRRRRRRRGHNTNTKRIAVDASMEDNNPIRHAAERPGPSSGISHKKFNKLGKTNLTSSVVDPLLLDSFGMKRKRTIAAAGSASLSQAVAGSSADSKLQGDMDMADVGNLSLNSPEMIIDDQEMKSEDEDDVGDDDDDDDCSSCDSEGGDEDERGREADDEQSDWVFDEWSSSSNPNKTREESASSRKKRLLKMLRNYNDMISANVGGGGQGLNSTYEIQTREIRAGKRRVFISKPGFPTKGIWTSANEEVSKFLQDPLQSQIRLQPISAEEGQKLSHLASLYSLRMDYCPGEEQKIQDIPLLTNTTNFVPDKDDGDSMNAKLIPVLTKTPNTTQMDKTSCNDPLTVSSPFNANAEGSSSSNVSSVYGPTYSDVDSRTSDSKRIKK